MLRGFVVILNAHVSTPPGPLMKLTRTVIYLLFVATNYVSFAQKYIGEFAQTEFSLSPKRLSFFVDMFETKKQLIDFMEINKGDMIAEVGAGNGENLGVLSLFYDSITFYAQDIDPKVLSEKKLKKVVGYYEKLKGKQTNKFQVVIGTTSHTNLADKAFDKILLIDAYHDFNKKDDMLEDICAKLKLNGKVYILDGFSFPGDTVTCPDSKQKLTTLPIEIRRFEDHGLFLTKMRSPDHRAHYGNALVFEKDKNKSDEFFKRRSEIDSYVNRSLRFSQVKVASDSVLMMAITDSILPKIGEITEVYNEYEVWIKDLGLRYLRKAQYRAAINVSMANTRFFPNSYQAWYWLGMAYMENNQKDLAIQSFNRSLKLNPDNKLAAKRINKLN